MACSFLSDSEVWDIALPASLRSNNYLKRFSAMQGEQRRNCQVELDAQEHLHGNNLNTVATFTA